MGNTCFWTLVRGKRKEKTQKTPKKNENKHFDDFFQSSNQHNKINELKYS